MTMSIQGLTIRSAERKDAGLIYALVCELADYEKMRSAVDASESDIAEALFGTSPRVYCEIAEWNGAAAGFALWFYNYSTFRGRYGIYLEDLYVRPAFRGNGIGRALIVNLARRCADEKLPRLQWQVLDWNLRAIDFYQSLGANVNPEWVCCRLEGESIKELALSG